MGSTYTTLGIDTLKAYTDFLKKVDAKAINSAMSSLMAFYQDDMVEPNDEAVAWKGRPWIRWQPDAM